MRIEIDISSSMESERLNRLNLSYTYDKNETDSPDICVMLSGPGFDEDCLIYVPLDDLKQAISAIELAAYKQIQNME